MQEKQKQKKRRTKNTNCQQNNWQQPQNKKIKKNKSDSPNNFDPQLHQIQHITHQIVRVKMNSCPFIAIFES